MDHETFHNKPYLPETEKKKRRNKTSPDQFLIKAGSLKANIEHHQTCGLKLSDNKIE